MPGVATQIVWTASDWFAAIGLGALAGAIGQSVRIIVGLKKLSDTASATNQAMADLFEPGRLLISLLIGAIAGILAATTILKSLTGISSQEFFALAAAGYTGADFIEGFARRIVPDAGSQDSTPPPADAGVQDGAVG